MMWTWIASAIGLALMFEAGRRFGHARHHAVCHEAPDIPIEWEAAVERLRQWTVDPPQEVDGFTVVHSILDAAFPGMIQPLPPPISMPPDEAADILADIIPDFDKGTFLKEVERFTKLFEEQISDEQALEQREQLKEVKEPVNFTKLFEKQLEEEQQVDEFLDNLNRTLHDQDPGADDTYGGAG